MPPINFLAVIAATFANMVLGAVWYGAFGKAWLRGLGKQSADIDSKHPLPYVIATIGSFLNALALAILLHTAKVETLPGALALGAGVSVGLTGAAMAKHYSFSGWPSLLFLIDYGVDLVGFLVMCALLVLLS